MAPYSDPYMVVELMTYGSRSGQFDALMAPPVTAPMLIWYDNPVDHALGVRGSYY